MLVEDRSEGFEKVLEGAYADRNKRIARKVKPLIQREKQLLAQAEKTDAIIPTTEDFLAEALTSDPFRVRVEAGINRLRVHNAESGIGIMTNGAEIVFPSIDLGTTHPKTLRESDE